jgi:hypothetical protein
MIFLKFIIVVLTTLFVFGLLFRIMANIGKELIDYHLKRKKEVMLELDEELEEQSKKGLTRSISTFN